MSSILRNAAVAAVSQHQPSSFYDRGNRPNPMLQALDQELKLLFGYLKRISTPGYAKPAEEPNARSANTLFELWNKYQPRLPLVYYEQKILEVGDFLMSIKEYKLALWHCYERYLQSSGNIDMEECTDIDKFQATFFPHGLKAENTELTSRALMGKCICMYMIVKLDDPKLHNKQSVDRCIQILSFLRLTTQVILPKESLCWLVYNGTIHIYSISRHLMTLGHSSSVLEYLLWASMCMETSVPLLTAKYLSWRATLYTAVCQCYYDCKADEHAESFAKRGLVKINELSNLELMSNSNGLIVYEDPFRSATIRMAIMVFKRSVIETRRKPKGLLRPKTRANLKEVLNMPWPRTPTENLLADMFEGCSAQFLAILESLSNSNRRILQTSPPASDNEPEILDVYSELFMAAQEILAGGGGHRLPGTKSQMTTGISHLVGVTLKGSLIQMATKGEDNVPLESVIRLVKLAYAYENWDVFEILLTQVLARIKESNDETFLWDEKTLELLSAMEKVNSSLQQKKQPSGVEEEEVEKPTAELQNKKMKGKSKTIEKPVEKPHEPVAPAKSNYGDDLIQVADVLMSIVTGTYEQNKIEVDLVVDATLFLWTKCKPIFQKFQTSSVDNPRFLIKMENPNKEQEKPIEFTLKTSQSAWIYLLDTIHQAAGWCGISCVDPVFATEVALRLALVYESIAKMDSVDVIKSSQRESKTSFNDLDSVSTGYQSNKLSLDILASPRDNILRAKNILQIGLTNVSCARRIAAMNDGKNIADMTCIKEFTNAIVKDKTDENVNMEGHIRADNPLPDNTTVWTTVKDLHLELLLMYHRICLKLCALDADASIASDKKKMKQGLIGKKETPKANLTEKNMEDFNELCNQCKKNYLSKALLLAQRAITLGTEHGPTAEQNKLLEDAVNLVQRVQMEEKRNLSENIGVNKVNVLRKIPPPPILLCRTDTFMVFRPAPFDPESGEKVAWYRIFARSASALNVKARLSDNCISGTGEETPSLHCEMKVTNLEPNQRYVFAVAAYTASGKLIGDHIGETTKPFLAFHPLPVFMAWAFISQMAYKVGHYSTASQASRALWDHFVVKPQPSAVAAYNNDSKKISLLRLNQRAMSMLSPVLLRHFLTSIFINTDIAVKEGHLFCDIICDKGICYDLQVQRLHQCERMLVAVELAGWLNEASLALQAVVQIYGLLAPMIYHKIPIISIVQILQRCHAVLQEIPQDLLRKRQTSISDSLNHMIACIGYYIAKTVRSWGQKDIANSIIESSRYLLSSDAEFKLMDGRADVSAEHTESNEKEEKRKRSNVAPIKTIKKENLPKELMALEAYIATVNQSAFHDHELHGNEEPSVLHAYIACLPSSAAIKEVEKFKSAPGYLEFLVNVSQKGLIEGFPEQVLHWCVDGDKWLAKRDESMTATRNIIKKPGGVTVIADNQNKFSATMGEYKKDSNSKGGKNEKAPVNKNVDKKKTKYKPLRVSASMSEASQIRQEEAELKALDTLSLYFVDLFRSRKNVKAFRKIVSAETPWRSQMNIIQGLCHFNILLQKLQKRDKMFGLSANRNANLDQEWFTLETAGVMIIGSKGETSRDQAVIESFNNAPVWEFEQKMKMTDKQAPSPIELAAAAVSDPPLATAHAQQVEPADTPRTYRSDKALQQDDSKEDNTLTTSGAIEALVNTCTHFRRAMVLAHRGQYWALLQNVVRAFWNCAHTALLRICTANQYGGDPGLLTTDALWTLLCHPFYVASDCLLDMMAILQDSSKKMAKNKDKIFGDHLESWMGTIQSEQGGASLKFDPLLDDNSIVDTRWICRLILRTLELLFIHQKYERLVDIALRFNALTNNCYTEQIIPLVVQAQLLLKKRIKQVGGAAPPQPHFKILQAQLGHVIYAKDYLKAQLTVQIHKEELAAVEPGVHIDPVGHGAYTKQDAFRLSAVPLDTTVSLKELHDTIDQTHYTARALKHSRKLLCLYLAGQQNFTRDFVDQEDFHVDFKNVTEQPHPTMPPNKITSQFFHVSEFQYSPLPQSQLGTVISSYEKTIEMLKAKNQKGIAAQAMHELGNICFNSKNNKGALYWWCQSLDAVVKINDAVHSWRSNLQKEKDISAAFLNRCGLWGCLLAGVLASNIAQYVLADENELRAECCLLSGFLFKALFRSSLPHPTADRDYALYSVGEGFEVTSLTPGIDFMSNKFRCDARQLVAALKWVTEELSRAQYSLFALPLLTLSEYFMSSVCQDVQLTVEIRILRVRTLTDLELYSEAILALQYLLNGEHLPMTVDSSLKPKETKSSLVYSVSKSLQNQNNLRAADGSKGDIEAFKTCKEIWNKFNFLIIESLLSKHLSYNMSIVFGPHLTCHLALVQAHLLIKLANTIPVLPKTDEQMQIDKGKAEIKSAVPSKPNSTALQKRPEFDSILNSGAIFTNGARTLTLEEIKGTILNNTEQTLANMLHVILEGTQDEKQEALPAAELELSVQCRLEQTCIAQQKHHAPMAARTALSALKMIQKAKIFKHKKPESPHFRSSSMKSASIGGRSYSTSNKKISESEYSKFQYQNLQARLRLDARLWLQCRYELVRSLLMEIRGMGEIKGSKTTVVSDMADCRQYCAEGLGEAEVCGNLDMQANFIFLGAQLNIIEGKGLDHTISLLKEAIRRLRLIPQCSDTGEQLLTSCIIFKADLEAMAKSDKHPDTLMTCLGAQKIILERLELLGEKIEHHSSDGKMDHLSSPKSPLQNVYLPYVQRLVEVKLRIGHAMARSCVKMGKTGNAGDLLLKWADSLGVLTTALEISQVSASRKASFESEILLMMGKVQKMMVYLDKYDARTAVSTFLKAIRISYINSHDLGLIRQAYLEIALLYQFSADSMGVEEILQIDPVTDTSIGDDQSIVDPNSPSEKEKQILTPEQIEYEKERTATLYAIRCASAVAYALRSRSVIIGDRNVISDKVEGKAVTNLPDFLALDLLSRNVLGEKKKTYKNEIEEELALLVESQEVKASETYDSQINKVKAEIKNLNWIHLLGYQTILQRLINTATVCASSSQTEKINKGGDDVKPDLHFASHANIETSMNEDVVRYMLHSGGWSIRLTVMHSYLFSNLKVYANNCCAPYPPADLSLVRLSDPSTDLKITMTSYTANIALSFDVEFGLSGAMLPGSLKYTLPPGSNLDIFKPDDHTLSLDDDPELVVQWYQPGLEIHRGQQSGNSAADRHVILLYAVASKNTKLIQGFKWVPLHKVYELYDKFAHLARTVDISVVGKKEPIPLGSAKVKSSKRTKIPPKLDQDKKLERTFRHCLDDAWFLMKGKPRKIEENDPQFNMDNVKNLENMFDPSLGLMLKASELLPWLIKLFT